MDFAKTIEAIKFLNYENKLLKGLTVYEGGYLLCNRPAKLADLNKYNLYTFMEKNLSKEDIEIIEDEVSLNCV